MARSRSSPYLHYRDQKSNLFYEVYLKDCRDMAEVKSGTVDLVVTSPPFNIGKEYEENFSFEEYLDFTRTWVAEVVRVLKPNGSFWLDIGFFKASQDKQYIPWSYYLYHLIKEIGGLYFVQEIVWAYGAGVHCKRKFSPRKETWMFYVKDLDNYKFNLDAVRVPSKYPRQFKNGRLKVNPKGKNPGDVWFVPKVTSGKNRSSPERTFHPAQFPEAVIRRIVKVSTDPGDVVLDPFLGSGTTMKVARDLSRSCIGYEIEQRYVDGIVRKRVFDRYTSNLDGLMLA